MREATRLYTKGIRMVEVVEPRPLRPWSRMVELAQLRPPCLGRVLLARGPAGVRGCGDGRHREPRQASVVTVSYLKSQ
jgi:hypothetical protein